MSDKQRGQVTDRGQVTIPKRLRERLGIRPGALLEFGEGEAGQLVVRKVTAESPVDAAYGILGVDQPTDEFVDALRGEADPP